MDTTHPLWSDREQTAAMPLVEMALREDLGSVGDITSAATIPKDLHGKAVLAAREPGVIAGLPVVQMVLAQLSPQFQIEWLVSDGAEVLASDKLGRVSGPMGCLLTGERTALNFLQRLSGVATKTRTFVNEVQGTSAIILDTRKTTPGWRVLEKYAVRCGGGHNHRMGLFDGILIKDNHLAALGQFPDALTRAVRLTREQVGSTVPLEIEIDRLDQLEEALACGPDMILLDNMSLPDMREAVRRRDAAKVPILLEASGGVKLDRVADIAATGVDRISVGGLTHSARALDIALDYEAS
jgi:nicotinate-nucleotide pyrophosphorylase (carboxylating)